MDPEIQNNIDGHIFRDVQGFHDKYFRFNQFDPAALSKTEQWLATQSKYGWNDPNCELPKSGLIAWIELFEDENNAQWERWSSDELHILKVELKARTSLKDDNTFTRVIGIHAKPGAHSYGRAIGMLCGSARGVFRRDPTRLFLHAFLLSGQFVESWVFDRAGPYCCTPYDICEEPQRFTNAMCTYTYLSEGQLGANTFVAFANGIQRVFVDEESSRSGIQPLYLDPRALDEGSGDIITDHPIVYFASISPSSASEFVVKFKWRREFDVSEGDFLESLKQKQVWATVQLYHQADITSTSTLREGLVFGKPLGLIDQASLSPEIEDCRETNTCFFRTSQNGQKGSGHIERCLSCIAIYPKGVELEEYRDPIEAIEGFRDALKGHRSLYQRGRLLHRDVSIFNIMLTANAPTTVKNAPKGFLIDVDGALDLDNPPKRKQIIGTQPFMAIDLLKSQLPHTYRYDLESFLYCLVWFCISPRSTTIRPPQGSKLWRWREDDWTKLADIKLHDMAEEQFQKFLDEFHPDFQQFQSLAVDLRNHLFPIRNGQLWTGSDMSDESTDSLYDALITAFEQATTTTNL